MLLQKTYLLHNMTYSSAIPQSRASVSSFSYCCKCNKHVAVYQSVLAASTSFANKIHEYVYSLCPLQLLNSTNYRALIKPVTKFLTLKESKKSLASSHNVSLDEVTVNGDHVSCSRHGLYLD
jgi:hypothetical protein